MRHKVHVQVRCISHEMFLKVRLIGHEEVH